MVDYDLGKVVGDKGDTGNGISSIELISTSGKVKTYRITFTDGDHFDYQVSDGADGSSGIADIVTTWSATLSDTKVPSEKLAKNSLDAKLDNAISSTAVTIASNDNILITDYSDSNKVKRVSSILASQMKDSNAHSNIGSSANASQSTINTSIDTALSNKANSSSLSTVATTGSYNDLTNKPSIPSKISDLTNDSDFIETSSTSGLIKNDGTVDTTSYSTFSGSYNDLSNKPTIPTKISDLTNDSDFIEKSNTSGLVKNDGTIDTTTYLSSLPSHNHDDRYYTESEMDTALSNKISKSNASGLVRNDGTIDASNYITSSALSGYQTTSNLVTSFSANPSDSKYPSEKLTKTELNNKIAKSSTTGLVKNDGSIDTNTYLTSSAITGMLTTSDIANNLTTTTTGKVLDARQGKALATLIGDAITYINQ